MYAANTNLRKALILPGMLLLLALVTGCKDIIEKDISGDTPVVILPQTDDTIAVNPVHIKWEELEGATKYHIQIVSPSFSNISLYAVDSVVQGTNFYIPLDSNSYELKITALNAGYESHSTAAIPFVVSSNPSGGPGGSVVLVSPAANACSGQTTVTFDWNAFPNAESYIFELHSGPSFADPLEYGQDQLGVTGLTLNNLSEGTYSWGVKAFYNGDTETAFTKRVLYIDTTAPGTTTLISPANFSTVSTGSVTFTWSVQNGGFEPSPVTSVFEIATDNTFTSMFNTQTLTGTSVTVPNMVFDTYFWRVKTIDAAGNTGITSPTYTLSVF
jgi:hypothetical protein